VFKSIGQWVVDYLAIPGIPGWASVVIISALMAVGSIAVTILALIRIPANYFRGPHPPGDTRWKHPVLRWTVRVFRNVVGWFLVLLGVIMSFPGVPGQGLLTILLGLMLVEFPGKRRMEQRFVRWPRVHDSVNALRKRFGQGPLELDDDE
jgi:Putative transmembrane protein (PGPGW)